MAPWPPLSQFFLVFDGLESLNSTGQVFYRTFISLGLSDVFSWLDWLMGWGEEDHRDDMLFSHIVPGVHAIHVALLVILTLITWLRWALPAFSSENLVDYVSLSILYSFFFLILFLNFTILYWFCQISKWIRHRYTCVPHPEPSSLLPPHTIPLGRPNAPAPSIQYRASNLDW